MKHRHPHPPKLRAKRKQPVIRISSSASPTRQQAVAAPLMLVEAASETAAAVIFHPDTGSGFQRGVALLDRRYTQAIGLLPIEPGISQASDHGYPIEGLIKVNNHDVRKVAIGLGRSHAFASQQKVNDSKPPVTEVVLFGTQELIAKQMIFKTRSCHSLHHFTLNADWADWLIVDKSPRSSITSFWQFPI